ncbi:transcription-repair coupling factor [Bombilactobacillus thymidiniphilus]|uniref:Transcription-repair-coupling factor n=1 Tax=Bombilactobacillus thymidiniphilus TaxID=2923363 RepID=A0ABY4PE71_9LACO|nr:transcription-repair coupling factor [Bombilactobacillus thymidiniphilus]UQS84026.1 transcription-repair coupling factor [Bombilactobacillus thymidiniphilus]
MQLIDFLKQNHALHNFITNLRLSSRQLLIGLNGSAKTLFLTDLLQQTQQPILVVLADGYHAQQLVEDLRQLLPEEQVQNFTVEANLATQLAISSPEERRQRLQTLNFLTTQQPGIVVTSVAGWQHLLPTPHNFVTRMINLEVGQEFSLAELTNHLVALGYRRDSLVAQSGEFAVRGDIFDFYDLIADQAVRIEFFGDEIEKISQFDPQTQRVQKTLPQVTIMPASEYLLSTKQLQTAGQKLQLALQKNISQVKDPQVIKNLQDHLQPDIDQLLQGQRLDHLGWYTKWLPDFTANLADYLPSTGTIVFDDYERLRTQEQTNFKENSAWLETQLEQGKLLPNQVINTPLEQIKGKIKQAQIYLSLFQRGLGRIKLQQLLTVNSRSVQQFFSNLPLLKTELERWQKQDYTVVLLISDSNRLQKMQQTLADFEIAVKKTTIDQLQKGTVQLAAGGLQTGIDFPDDKLVIITEKELFNKRAHLKRRRANLSNAERLKSYTDLKSGDYVVHVNHGIGKFLGIQTLEVDGKHQDYMTIEYRDDGNLFIPVTQLNMVQKYVSAEGKAPRLNKLGGTEWHKTKQKVQKSVENIANDLVKLYAKRQAEPGFSFAPEDELETKFDEQFPYIETPDQLRSIKEVKQDMQRPHPMERLLVGDVGFGKTEVALRAAFKAVNNNKQVAFLVPTTILAQQHYQTMLERFSGFPVKIAMMSRFQTTKQKNETKAGLANGTIDIVVGTHRLLSKDIKFANLGLLIIDEEQRFGVKHKELLKQLKSQIDVLSMTATPIPRTLNMSMMGVRDLSVIETPPPNRYPIQTFVIEQNYDVIKSAIEREMQRGGQVFYLHNRVEDMEQVVSLLESLLPEVRVGIANGQMTQTQLENVMTDFLNGEYDVLVATTIIETGVDIANANTLIVENADHYGLSQLYQLRGRVGRSSRIAYAYFMYQQDKTLTEVGEKRLEAIKNFTELGSGFKVAMRDLSIRGAGNLLGQQQHGFIDSVGYDLYTQMLNEAVAKQQGQRKVQQSEAELKFTIEAYIPSEYISDERQKIEMYKRLREARNTEQVTALQHEMVERFGKYPPTVAKLIMLTLLKVLADQAFIQKIEQQDKDIIITFTKMANQYLNGELIFADLSLVSMKAQVNNMQQQFVIKLDTKNTTDYLEQLQQLLTKLAEQAQTKEDSIS